MPALIGFIATFLARILGDNVLRWIAIKGALVFLFVVVLPVVFNNFLGDLLIMLFSQVNEYTSGSGDLTNGLNPEFTVSGLAAWFAIQMKFTECLSVIVSALVLKLTLKQIPFLRF